MKPAHSMGDANKEEEKLPSESIDLRKARM